MVPLTDGLHKRFLAVAIQDGLLPSSATECASSLMRSVANRAPAFSHTEKAIQIWTTWILRLANGWRKSRISAGIAKPARSQWSVSSPNPCGPLPGILLDYRDTAAEAAPSASSKELFAFVTIHTIVESRTTRLDLSSLPHCPAHSAGALL
jgi:hypothetical protein